MRVSNFKKNFISLGFLTDLTELLRILIHARSIYWALPSINVVDVSFGTSTKIPTFCFSLNVIVRIF